MKTVELRTGAFSNQSALNEFNSDLNDNFGDLTNGQFQTYTTVVDLTPTIITGTSAGQFGHANGVALVAAQTNNEVVELVSAVLIYNYGGAGYGGGGNITINATGGSALTGVASAANTLGQTADKIVQFVPLAATATSLPITGTGLSLVAASAFTLGSATGTAKVFVTYRVYTTGLNPA